MDLLYFTTVITASNDSPCKTSPFEKGGMGLLCFTTVISVSKGACSYRVTTPTVGRVPPLALSTLRSESFASNISG
jgi:hypothetical protein